MITDDQKRLLDIAADLATIATLIISVVKSGNGKPRRNRKPRRSSKRKR